MHIKDGVLSPEVCLATHLAAAAVVGYSLSRLRSSLADRTIPLTGMVASLVFAGQMVNFPLWGTPVSGHLLGGVLAATIVGPWAGCVAIAMVLFVQVALFYDGGWLVLGANVLNMAVVGSLGGYAVFAAVRRVLGTGRAGTVTGAVLAAWLSVLAGAALFCGEFRLSWPAESFHFGRIFTLMAVLHSGIGVGEALITGLVIGFVHSQRPDLIYTPDRPPALVARWSGAVTAGLVAALAVAAFLAPFASEYADGLDTVASQTGFADLERTTRVLALDDYRLPLPEDWGAVAVSGAGIGGTLAVMAVALVLGCALRPRGSPLPRN